MYYSVTHLDASANSTTRKHSYVSTKHAHTASHKDRLGYATQRQLRFMISKVLERSVVTLTMRPVYDVLRIISLQYNNIRENM